MRRVSPGCIVAVSYVCHDGVAAARSEKTRPALFRGRHFQDHVIVLCVRWYLRYCLTLHDLEEMMAERGLSGSLYGRPLGTALRPRTA